LGHDRHIEIYFPFFPLNRLPEIGTKKGSPEPKGGFHGYIIWWKISNFVPLQSLKFDPERVPTKVKRIK